MGGRTLSAMEGLVGKEMIVKQRLLEATSCQLRDVYLVMCELKCRELHCHPDM